MTVRECKIKIAELANKLKHDPKNKDLGRELARLRQLRGELREARGFMVSVPLNREQLTVIVNCCAHETVLAGYLRDYLEKL